MPNNFPNWFQSVTDHPAPRSWQAGLSQEFQCFNRLIRIPTGLGKTEGVLASWMWHRLEQREEAWPRRLVWCLPMRVLVQQTQRVASDLVERWASASGRDASEVPTVECLMGGVDAGDWIHHPEKTAILIGTQDMLLSRALNRGYASGRARWPVEFGLLNHDCLWVMDEVQLMDIGLATSVQLQAFREQEAAKSLRPCRTWWMSATLQEDWLETVDFHDELNTLRQQVLQVPPKERAGDVWNIRKPVRVETIPSKPKDDFAAWADLILKEHHAAEPDKTGRVTLVIVNTVDRAGDVHKAVTKAMLKDGSVPKVELIHSRFRGLEREQWTEEFLSRKHCENPETNLILISTQVVEAGVDISATALITELAPWPSLVQRFGRAARYGGTANVVVVDRQVDEKSALPYELPDLAAASEAITRLSDVGLTGLQEFEDDLRANDSEFLKRLYRYEYLHLLTRRECDELFDTSPDLTGADLDISRFIRSGDERDVQVCWIPTDFPGKADKPGDPPSEWQPKRGGLCHVPVAAARKWLFDGNKLKEECRAWCWDYLTDKWRPLTPDRCYPGQVFLIDAEWGGYDPTRGFTGDKRKKDDDKFDVASGFDRGDTKDDDQSDLGQSREDRSQSDWKTIATHGREVACEANTLLDKTGASNGLKPLFELAGLCHDWGKAHRAFQANIKRDDEHRDSDDLAKAPKSSWVSFRSDKYSWPEKNGDELRYGHRKGFRHELASTLALFELLARHKPDHPALLGPHRELFDHGVLTLVTEGDPASQDALTKRLADLTGEQFDLLVYLVASHHGKVRGAWQATPDDQEFPARDSRLIGTGQPLRGVREGDTLPKLRLFADQVGTQHVDVPEITLHLDPAAIGLSNRYGASWSERVQSLLKRHGPFTLAWLEALFRAADVRASKLETPDPLL